MAGRGTVREAEIRSLGLQPRPLAGLGVLGLSPLYLLNFRLVIVINVPIKTKQGDDFSRRCGDVAQVWGPSMSTGGVLSHPFWLGGRSRRVGINTGLSAGSPLQ